MKKIKKVASLLMTLVMVLSMGVVTHAEDAGTVDTTSGYTITIDNSVSGHTYEAYQIFTGDLHDGVLSNIVWGASVTGSGDLEDAKDVAARMDTAYTGTDKLTIEDLLEMITLSDVAYASSDGTGGSYVMSGLEAGYYLVKDQENSQTGEHDAYTRYILQVVEDVNIAPKSVFPTVDKEVWDEEADGETAGENWGETADHNLNESFSFKLIASLPASTHYADYEAYKLIFNDTMSAGVTFEKMVSVTVDGVTFTSEQYACSATENQTGGTWTLTLDDIKVEGVDLTDGAVVEVIYNAHLNENAVVGNIDDNKNTVYLQYSNNPNAGGEGDLGQTEEDTVWVFTYELDVTKVDGKDNTQKLKDAQFRLYREVTDTIDQGATEGADGGDVGDTSDGTETVTKEYVIVDENSKVTGWTKDETRASILISGDDGLFKIIGLDHGVYQLEEIKAPAGYNLLEAPVEVVIHAVHTENIDKISAQSVIKINDADAIIVENNAGTTLPETGGIGTTIFYIVGSMMIIGAGIILVLKLRIGAR